MTARAQQVRELVRSLKPELAHKVQFATGQLDFSFQSPHPQSDGKTHDWKFQGIDLKDGALSRFRCPHCGCWMHRRQCGTKTSVCYFEPDAAEQFPPLSKRPDCKRKGAGHA
jgi:hypothetical protein